jgi:uncharacterized membrane protein
VSGWVLSAAYALHMAATVAWVGGLTFQSLLLPSLTRSLEPLTRARFYEALSRRFQPIALLSLAILVFTGLSQMAAHPSYAGILEINGRWAQAILVKHLAFGVMVAVAGYQTWSVQPGLTRMMLIQAAGAGAADDEIRRILARIDRLTRLNTALALIVLALTAVARTA